MFNFGPLPDLLLLTVLVFVFWSILRQRAGEQLHAWLLGWIFILLHFAVQLFGARPGGLQTFVMALSAMMLELAGASFIYAAGAGKSTRRMRWVASTGIVATLLYILLLYLGAVTAGLYYATLALLAGSVEAVLFPDTGRPVGERNLYAAFGFVLILVLAFLVHVGQQNYGLDAIFFAIYAMAGIQYWRNFPHRSTGCITAVVGLIAWAFVFPISAMLAVEQPNVHIQDSFWNIPKYIVAMGILLTLLEEQINRTEHLALHDPLTGLPNRRLLEDRLIKAIERAERNEARVAVLLVDLDSFKQINDTYGHPTGDEVLKIVASRLQTRVRKADTIARAGGDEFLVVVSDLLQPQGATVLAAKIMADLKEPIVLGDIVLRAEGSIGVAIYPDDADTAEALCAKADASMYAQKRRSNYGTGSGEKSIGPLNRAIPGFKGQFEQLSLSNEGNVETRRSKKNQAEQKPGGAKRTRRSKKNQTEQTKPGGANKTRRSKNQAEQKGPGWEQTGSGWEQKKDGTNGVSLVPGGQ